METVVRGTKTIEEFKRVREDMLKRAERYSRKHIASCENWQEGFPVKCWRGALGVLWIEYREECFALPFFFMLFSGLHIMIVKRKRMENRKYLVARSPFVK